MTDALFELVERYHWPRLIGRAHWYEKVVPEQEIAMGYQHFAAKEVTWIKPEFMFDVSEGRLSPNGSFFRTDPQRPVFMRGEKHLRRFMWQDKYAVMTDALTFLATRYWRMSRHSCPMDERGYINHYDCVSKVAAWAHNQCFSFHRRRFYSVCLDMIWVEGEQFETGWWLSGMRELNRQKLGILLRLWDMHHGSQVMPMRRLAPRIRQWLGSEHIPLDELVGLEVNGLKLVRTETRMNGWQVVETRYKPDAGDLLRRRIMLPPGLKQREKERVLYRTLEELDLIGVVGERGVNNERDIDGNGRWTGPYAAKREGFDYPSIAGTTDG